MRQNTKIKFIAGCTAFSIILGGYSLIKNDYEKNRVLTYVTDCEDVDKSNRCKLNVINNVTEDVNISLMDINGNIVDTWIQNDTPHYISNLNQGLYTMECKSDSFSFIENNIAINPDMYTEMYICNGYSMIEYFYDQDDLISYNSNLVLTKRK